MKKENKVSLWLGYFENAKEFKEYIEGSYDADGNYIPSKFQEDFAIKRYDMDAIESDWISERCSSVETLLAGFSFDDEIVPQFKEKLKQRTVDKYNSILILYNFEYVSDEFRDVNLEYMGCVNVNL